MTNSRSSCLIFLDFLKNNRTASKITKMIPLTQITSKEMLLLKKIESFTLLFSKWFFTLRLVSILLSPTILTDFSSTLQIYQKASEKVCKLISWTAPVDFLHKCSPGQWLPIKFSSWICSWASRSDFVELAVRLSISLSKHQTLPLSWISGTEIFDLALMYFYKMCFSKSKSLSFQVRGWNLATAFFYRSLVYFVLQCQL